MVKVMELKGGQRYENIPVCFETCMEVTGNIQWEVTLARSALSAPYMVHINPKNTATLQRLLAGAATEANKQTNKHTRLLLLCRPAHIFNCMITNCFSTRDMK